MPLFFSFSDKKSLAVKRERLSARKSISFRTNVRVFPHSRPRFSAKTVHDMQGKCANMQFVAHIYAGYRSGWCFSVVRSDGFPGRMIDRMSAERAESCISVTTPAGVVNGA